MRELGHAQAGQFGKTASALRGAGERPWQPWDGAHCQGRRARQRESAARSDLARAQDSGASEGLAHLSVHWSAAGLHPYFEGRAPEAHKVKGLTDVTGRGDTPNMELWGWQGYTSEWAGLVHRTHGGTCRIPGLLSRSANICEWLLWARRPGPTGTQDKP